MEFEMFSEYNSIIKVVGVGGGGCNAVNYMYEQGIPGVNFAVCNTDKQDLEKSGVPTKIQLGVSLLEGLGAGANPEEGRKAALEAEEEIRMYLGNNTKMVFITAGMGGGTGTGAGPIVAKVARDMDILTVGIVTMPFNNEGKPKRIKAEHGIENMKENVDALIVVSNNKLYDIYPDLDIDEAFSKADDILATAAKGVTEIITKPGKINVDFNDVKRIMENSGVALIGIGRGSGDDRAEQAIQSAITSPLLEDTDIYGAKGVVLYISYGNTFKMRELDLITETVQDETQSDCELIWGVCKDESLGDDIAITLIATGFETGETSKQRKKKVQVERNKVVHSLSQQQEQEEIVEPKVVISQVEVKEEKQVVEEIKLVQKPRNTVVFDLFDNDKEDDELIENPTKKVEDQFSLYELDVNQNEIANDDAYEAQDLEKELIRKRIAVEMQKNNSVSLHELEKEPAYKRYGLDINDDKDAIQSNISNYTIYDSEKNPGKIEIKPNAMKDIYLD